MTHTTLWNRLGWLAMVALVLASGRLLHADDALPPPVPEKPPVPTEAPRAPEAPRRSSRWLGLGCVAVDDARRTELKLEASQGLEVGDVVPDGPADGADINPGDVLLSADGKSLAKVEDLVAIVEASDGKPIKLTVWNHGQTRDVEVTPAERPRRERWGRAPRHGGPDHPPGFPGLPGGFSFEELRRWLPGGAEGPGPSFMWLGPGVMVGEPFPEDVELRIEKHGRQPAKIHVERGGQSWDATEDNLANLPDEVRPHVERMFGRLPFLHGRWGEGGEHMRREIERHAHEGAERARHEAQRAREQGEHLAREGVDRARDAAEQIRERVEMELRHRLPHLAPGGPTPPPGADGAPPGLHQPPDLQGLIDEQIRRRVEKPLGDLQRQLDELRRSLDSQAVADRLRKELAGPIDQIEKLRDELGKSAEGKAGQLDKLLKDRGAQLEQLLERSGRRLEELLERLPKSEATPEEPPARQPAAEAEDETNI